jgi:BolA protein
VARKEPEEIIMSIADSLREKVFAAFSPQHFELENESHGHRRGVKETHFKMLVVASAFEGLSRVERQRRVQALFEQERAQGLHALSLRLLTPEEWQKSGITESFQSPPCVGVKVKT